LYHPQSDDFSVPSVGAERELTAQVKTFLVLEAEIPVTCGQKTVDGEQEYYTSNEEAKALCLNLPQSTLITLRNFFVLCSAARGFVVQALNVSIIAS
jgi:hypothetical protein